MFPVRTMCRVFGVSPSGFYAWNWREPSMRAIEDARLKARIRFCHARSKGAYGAPNILEDLRDEGIRVGKKRVARLMKADGLRSGSRRPPAMPMRCQGQPKFPQLWQSNLPHPVQESFASSARTSPAFSFSLSR
jgi:putative transposase